MALSPDGKMVAEKPGVSIVIPVYNRIELAASAIVSAADQTYPNIEIIVVDDGSTEDLGPVEEVVRVNARRATLLRQANSGPACARNAGWSVARGSYVAFLDADDLFLPDKVATQLLAMKEVDCVFSHTTYWRHWRGRQGLELVAPTIGNDLPEMIASCAVATPTVMLRRDLWDEGYRFPEEIRVGEDVVLWLRIAARYGVLKVDRPMTIVRANSSSAGFDPATLARGLNNILAEVRASPDLLKHSHYVTILANQAADAAAAVT